MKKLVSLLLVLALAAVMVTGCSAKKAEDAPKEEDKNSEKAPAEESIDEIKSLKTLGDVYDLDSENLQTSVYDEYAVQAFQIGNNYYRVTAPISKKDSKAYMDVDYSDDDFEEQQRKILSKLEIEKKENLNSQILSDDELAKLKGKTGKELVDEGWTYGGSFLYADMQIEMYNGPFSYYIYYDGKVDEKDYEDYDVEKGTADMKVKSAVFNGIGDATRMEE